MPKQLANFDTMWERYPEPSGEAEVVKALIGGEVNVGWVTNTCCVRLSRSLNAAGFPVPGNVAGLVTLRGADGLRYALRVEETRKYLTRTYGDPQIVVPLTPPAEPPQEISGRQGILCFQVKGWSDATGHFDLWNGQECRHHAYFDLAWRVLLWTVPSSGAPLVGVPPLVPLSGSVGAGGTNTPDDVRRVQVLLRARGYATGDADGVCGEATVAAIRSLQARFMARPDGRVDPGGRSWRELNGQ